MFTHALQVVLEHEGGYINYPSDPGGETNMGICKRDFPDLDIKTLTLTIASQIYRSQYWIPCRCDDLPDGLDLMVFDCAVNQGVKTACILLQQAVGVKADGKLGPYTLSAIAEQDFTKIITIIAVSRVFKYLQATEWHRYGKGWLNRLFDVYSKCFNQEL